MVRKAKRMASAARGRYSMRQLVASEWRRSDESDEKDEVRQRERGARMIQRFSRRWWSSAGPWALASKGSLHVASAKACRPGWMEEEITFEGYRVRISRGARWHDVKLERSMNLKIAAIRSGTDPVGKLPDGRLSSLAGYAAELSEVRCDLQPGRRLGPGGGPLVSGELAPADYASEEGGLYGT